MENRATCRRDHEGHRHRRVDGGARRAAFSPRTTPGHGARDTLHLLMSVSKSIVGILVGALARQGVLNVEEQVTAYVPELEQSGYRGATVRQLLDMRSGIEFSEDYLDPDAEVRVLEQAIGWAPRRSPDVPTDAS